MSGDTDCRYRWELLGRLTEEFNDAEHTIHWLVQFGLGSDTPHGVSRAVTQRLGASELAGLVRRLLDAGAYGDRRADVRALLERFGPLADGRNRYVHAVWWLDADEDGNAVDVHVRLKDLIGIREVSASPFNASALQNLIDKIETFVIDAWILCTNLSKTT